jgi:hypothetical protein
MRRALALLITSFALGLFGLGVGACGGDDDSEPGQTQTTEETTETTHE